MSDIDNSRYSFNVEWHDTEASIIRTFILFYYKVDGTIELYDTKYRRMFLRRTKCDSVTLGDLHIDASVNILSRQMKITGFADEYTHVHLGIVMQRTFAMLKPDAVEKMGQILKLIIENGFKVTKLKMVQMTKEHALEFYAEHKGKPFLPFLVEYMTSGPVIAMELLAENGVAKWRELLGPTDSEQARKDAPGSIRARFGKDKSLNAAHGSDSCISAERELNIFFPMSRIAQYESPRSTATFKNTTCCIIKPHAVQEGLLGDIVSEIQENGFKITAMQMFYMEHPNAQEFYEVYKGVLAEYSGMVNQLVSGASVAMEIAGSDADTPSKFRAFVGPADPELARKLRPTTLRAKFGKTRVQNAVHCTDLPEDGLLEVEYFFKILE
ncbi:Nucleoside diphosphate kinase 7 [Cryptotermes secundus]|uniref:Nucleoside diphosphate kinase 7 n=1 Tax=Cryptotermes secundus TaxID=105785 RepID=A0A2J7QC66_9NEOP|nr:nucleoside diphosphate kinase 7 isoform X3 [Cryptotermes secundus]PNF26159.1 Nucleoside diphosphate kinase 7 [Cryptotermes secundus]PNF26162.1 Nucleoside diphosphate kinase 7 [Cryptotermes secundus]